MKTYYENVSKEHARIFKSQDNSLYQSVGNGITLGINSIQLMLPHCITQILNKMLLLTLKLNSLFSISNNSL